MTRVDMVADMKKDNAPPPIIRYYRKAMVEIDQDVHEAVKARAEKERRTVKGMYDIILREVMNIEPMVEV